VTNALRKLDDATIPLCVDLDHTFFKTDTLYEHVLSYIRSNPFRLLRVMNWLRQGRSYLKAKLQEHAPLTIDHFPVDEDVFYYLKRMEAKKRPIVLVTGAHQSIADAVIKKWPIFQAAHGSQADHNLVGAAKEKLLVSTYGAQGFDYLGDSKEDLHVWKSARHASIVGSNAKIIKELIENKPVDKIILRSPATLQNYLKAIRIHQWVKNILIFSPLLLSHEFRNSAAFFATAIGFFSFSFTASIVYVLNDLFDLESDRKHPSKKNRPFAAGIIGIEKAPWIIGGLSLGLGAGLIALDHLAFTLLLVGYFSLTTLYSSVLKKLVLVDVMVLSLLYCMRIFAGSLLTGIQISPWLLGFSGFFFLCLALIKRCSELELSTQELNNSRGYTHKELPILYNFAATTATAAIVVFALYLNSPQASAEYKNLVYIWAISPILFYWLARILVLTIRQQMDSDPVRFAIRDKVSWLCYTIMAGLWVLGSF
jgi:4-hydroxybenzoate polyprenyltransferase